MPFDQTQTIFSQYIYFLLMQATSNTGAELLLNYSKLRPSVIVF
jgi:hypothetical protein